MNSITGTPNLRIKSVLVTILLLSAFVLPFGYRLDLGPGPNGVRAILWEYLDAPWFSGIRLLRVGQMLEALAYTFPTYLFIYQVYNHYFGKTNRKQLLILGILSTIFPGIVSLIQVIGWLQGWTQPPPPLSDPYFPIYIPIPSTVFISLLLFKLIPRRTI